MPETKAGKNRLHLDLYPTGRDDSLPLTSRIDWSGQGRRLVALDATVVRRTRNDDPDDPIYYVVMTDPEGNEFCAAYVMPR